MRMRDIFRLLITSVAGLLLFIFSVLFVFATETIADELGYVKVIRTLVRQGVSDMSEAGYLQLVGWSALLFVGGALALWGDYYIRKAFPPKFGTKKEKVEGVTFRHEEVIIDGKSFQNCKFLGVTLVYNGTGSYDFIGCNFFDFSVRITQDGASGAIGLIKLQQESGRPFRFENSEPQ
jgi:hypothetical protein